MVNNDLCLRLNDLGKETSEVDVQALVCYLNETINLKDGKLEMLTYDNGSYTIGVKGSTDKFNVQSKQESIEDEIDGVTFGYGYDGERSNDFVNQTADVLDGELGFEMCI